MVNKQKTFQKYLYQTTFNIALNCLEKIHTYSTKEKNRLSGYRIRHHNSNMFAEFKNRKWHEKTYYKESFMLKYSYTYTELVLIHPFFIIHSKLVINNSKRNYDFECAIYSIKDSSHLFVDKLAKYFSNVLEEQISFYNQYIKVYKLNMAYQY